MNCLVAKIKKFLIKYLKDQLEQHFNQMQEKKILIP